MMENPSATLRRVVLLGHTGFMGREIKRLFLERAHGLEVIADTLPRLDLTNEQETEALASWLDSHTAVVMCAGIKRQLGDTLDIFQKNLAMAVNLGRLLCRHPVQRVVFLSSLSVYGEEVDGLHLSETTPVQPVSYYGLAKFTSEGLLRKAVAASSGSSLAILRPPLVYGWSDGGTIYGPSGFARAALEGRPIVLWGDGSELREFLLVDDLAEIVYRLTCHDFDGLVNVVSGRSRTYQDALAILEGQLGQPLNVTVRPRSRRQVDNAYDNSLLRGLLPDFSFTPLEEGLARTVKGCRENLPGCSAQRRAG